MKTREDLLRMLGVLVTSAKLLERDYDAGVVRWSEFRRRKQDFAIQVQVLVYVLDKKECFYTACSFDDILSKALALLDNANITNSNE